MTFSSVISPDPKSSHNTLFFTKVLRRELGARMKGKKKREFIAYGSRKSFKKLILSNNLGKIKNVCKRFPNVNKAFFIYAARAK